MKYRLIYTFATLMLASFAFSPLCYAQESAVQIHELEVVLASVDGTPREILGTHLDNNPTILLARVNGIPNEIMGSHRDNIPTIQMDELVVLTGEEATTDEIFGPKMGNIHAFVTIQGEYTDNVYNIESDEQSNFLTSISPGIWLIAPKSERLPIRISSYNTAVGGSRFSLPSIGSFDRFQTYLLGGFDYKTYSVDSRIDYTAWGLEGMFQYNLPAGISFRIVDKFVSDRDRIEVGSFDSSYNNAIDQTTLVSAYARLRDFISNQAMALVNIEMSERFSALLAYTNYYLDYDDQRDAWLDRIDEVLSLDLNYHHSPKTSLFVEGKYAISDYDTADYNDSDNLFFYGGINWHKSIKTQLMIKGGYQVKSFENRDRGDNIVSDDNVYIGDKEDVEAFVLESWFNYRYSDKTKMSFKIAKAIEETDTSLSTGKDSISSRFYYDHELSERFRLYFTVRFEHYDYEGYYLAGEDRDEYFIGLKPALQYDFMKWLMAELSYSFETRDSNIDIYDFTTQTVFLSLRAAF